MNEGVKNQGKKLLEIKNKENNRENKKNNCSRYTRGKYTTRQGVRKVDKQERIQIKGRGKAQGIPKREKEKT